MTTTASWKALVTGCGVACVLASPLYAQSAVAGPTTKLAWDQQTYDGQQIPDIKHTLAVDAASPSGIARTCTLKPSTTDVYECVASLPKMAVGVHVLRVTAKWTDPASSTEYSSAPSDGLSITFIAIVTPTGLRLVQQ